MDLNSICELYRDWVQSSPFDKGNTMSNALDPLILPENQKNLVQTAKMSAYQKNHNSCSNGCLMKCSPIAVWAQDLSKEDLRIASRAETEISHSNETSIDVCYIVNLAVKYLLNSNHIDPIFKS